MGSGTSTRVRPDHVAGGDPREPGPPRPTVGSARLTPMTLSLAESRGRCLSAARLPTMCGRFTQERPASELAEIFGAEPLVDDPGARFNVAPTDETLVVVQREDRRAITAYRWGLIPHWADRAPRSAHACSTRGPRRSRAARPSGTRSRRKRCLIPVDSFYEWKREGTIRQPYRVVRTDGRPLALAGLWAGWKDPATDTRPAHVHDRHGRPIRWSRTCTIGCPSSSPESAWARWLDPEPADPGELRAILEPDEEVGPGYLCSPAVRQ